MNMLIYGAGVQGQYLAHVLNQPENNITLLARGQNYKRLNNSGVVLNHYLQNKRTTDHFNYVSNLDKHDNYDIIFVTMKYSDFYSVVPSLAQNISTNIIFIGNNTDPHKLRQTVLRQSITHKNISFGFFMTGGNRGGSATTVIRFNAGELKVSHLNGVIPFHNKLDAIFKNSSIKLTYETRFEDWLMSHAAMIIPLNAGISLKNKYKENQKQLLSNMIKSYNELHSLIEHSNYNIVPKLQSTLFKNFKWLAYPLLKLIINIKIMNQIQGSNSEVNALYKDIKLLNKQTALTTNYLDEMIIELRS